MKQKRRLGLVLGGGGGKCFVHLPLLTRLEEQGIKISHISAASSGTIIASLWAAGYRQDEIIKMFTGGEAKKGFHAFHISRGGFVNGESMLNYMDQKLKSADLKDLKIPCSFAVLDATTGKFHMAEKGNAARNVVYSCAFPGIVSAKSPDNHVMVDGGIINAAPADWCRKKVGPNGLVVTSFLQGYFEPHPGVLDNPAKVLYRSVSVALEHHKRKLVWDNSDIVIDQLPNIPINFTTLFKYTADLFDSKKINFYLQEGKRNVDRKWGEIEKGLYK